MGSSSILEGSALPSFIIIGTGAIGSYIGGRLAASGAQVQFVGRRHSLQALARDGLLLTDLEGHQHRLPASSLNVFESLSDLYKNRTAPDSQKESGPISMEAPEQQKREALGQEKKEASVQKIKETPVQKIKEAPVLLVCVKGGATEEVGRDIQRFCPPGSTVVSLQNGVENVARLKSQAPSMRVLAGMVPYNVVLKSPVHCHRATSGTLLIERRAMSEHFLSQFIQAGLALELRQDMLEVQWGKLLLNLNNPINALSNLPIKAQLEDRGYRRALSALQTETLHVLARAGIKPAQVGKAPPRLLPALLQLPTWLFKRVAASMLKMDASARSSMSADLQAGRPTETDDLCGAVVRLAAAMSMSAPKNMALSQIIKDFQPGQTWTGDRLLKAITGDFGSPHSP
jgi:2-dehydropantoate 2-reductase